MTNTVYKWDQKLRLLLPYIFGVYFIITILVAFSFSLTHHPWTIGDWLINYQAGFVRRGLIGEFAYQLNRLTGISVVFFVFLLQSILYGFFYWYSFQILKNIKPLSPYIFLIFSPIIFTFQINDFQGGFRKEIIYFAIIAMVSFYYLFKETTEANRVFFCCYLILYPLALLSHEMLIIYQPYLVAVYLIKNHKIEYLKLAIYSIPSLIAFTLVVIYKGEPYQADIILQSLRQIGYNIIDPDNAIQWIGKDLEYLLEGANSQKIINYIICIFLGLLAFIPVIKNFQFENNKIKIYLLVVSSILATIILAIFILDWGRLIYIQLVSLFFLSLFLKNNEKYFKCNTLTIFLVVLYALFFQMDYINPKLFNQINTEGYIKAFELLFRSLDF